MISKKNIMIISNEPDINALLKNKLVDKGYEVFSTNESGEKLKGLLNELSPDLVIISMHITCFEAVELSLRIRRWCQIPIILVSSWGTEHNLQSTSEKGCALIKTNTIDDVMLRIENTFSRN